MHGRRLNPRLLGRHINPATLTAEIATGNYRDEEKGWEMFALLQPRFVQLNGSHTFDTEVPRKLGEDFGVATGHDSFGELVQEILESDLKISRVKATLIEETKPSIKNIEKEKSPISKCVYGKSYSFLHILMILILSICNCAYALHITSPVLWKNSNTKIISGHNLIKMKINLISPCQMLNTSMIHHEFTLEAQEKCEAIHKKYVLEEIEEFCDEGVLWMNQKRRASAHRFLKTIDY